MNEEIPPKTSRDDIKGLVKADYLKQQGLGQITVYIRTDKK